MNYISQELALLHCACELVLLITVVPAVSKQIIYLYSLSVIQYMFDIRIHL